jgi:hypothetical protein
MGFTISKDTDDGSWSKSGIYKKLKDGIAESGAVSAFNEEYAVIDGKVTKDIKESMCHLPHHSISSDGVLKLNINGLHAAASRFNQLSVSSELKDKAKAHLRKHYNAIGEEIPDVLKASKVSLSLSDVTVTQAPQHPNKMLWTGIVTRVGSPSTAAPCGTGGKLLVLSPEAAKKACGSMVNMPLNCEWPDDDIWCGACPEMAMTGHDTGNIIGTITEANVVNDALVCSGVIWKQNFPDVAFMINNAVDALGFSIEADINASTESEDTVTATDITFTGLATLWKKCAAWESTEFQQLVASRKNEEKDDVTMNEEQMKALLDAMLANVKTELATVQASVEDKVNTVVSEVKAEVDKANGEIATLAVALAETKEKIEAAAVPTEPVVEPAPVQAAVEPPVVPAPTVLAPGQAVVANADLTPLVDKEAKIKEINASAMEPLERCKAIAKIRCAQ